MTNAINDAKKHATWTEQNERDPHRIRPDWTNPARIASYIRWHRDKALLAASVICEAEEQGHPDLDTIRTVNTRIIEHHRAWIARLENTTTENDDLAAKQAAIRARQENQ